MTMLQLCFLFIADKLITRGVVLRVTGRFATRRFATLPFRDPS